MNVGCYIFSSFATVSLSSFLVKFKLFYCSSFLWLSPEVMSGCTLWRMSVLTNLLLDPAVCCLQNIRLNFIMTPPFLLVIFSHRSYVSFILPRVGTDLLIFRICQIDRLCEFFLFLLTVTWVMVRSPFSDVHLSTGWCACLLA